MTSKTSFAVPPKVRNFSMIGFTRTDFRGINVCGGSFCCFKYCLIEGRGESQELCEKSPPNLDVEKFIRIMPKQI